MEGRLLAMLRLLFAFVAEDLDVPIRANDGCQCQTRHPYSPAVFRRSRNLSISHRVELGGYRPCFLLTSEPAQDKRALGRLIRLFACRRRQSPQSGRPTRPSSNRVSRLLFDVANEPVGAGDAIRVRDGVAASYRLRHIERALSKAERFAVCTTRECEVGPQFPAAAHGSAPRRVRRVAPQQTRRPAANGIRLARGFRRLSCAQEFGG